MKETKILKEEKISLEIHIMTKLQNWKEPQISKETQIANKPQVSKEIQITNKPQILKEHTWTRVIKMQISHEGVSWLACASGTWRRRRTMWGGGRTILQRETYDSSDVECYLVRSRLWHPRDAVGWTLKLALGENPHLLSWCWLYAVTRRLSCWNEWSWQWQTEPIWSRSVDVWSWPTGGM